MSGIGSRNVRLCVFGVVALLTAALTLSLQLGVARGETEPAGEAPAPPSAEELPQKRTATSDTYRLHSGLLETRVYDTPVNFENDQGEWEPIEEGLEEGEGGEIVNGANSVAVSLPSELGVGPARLVVGDQWIASKLLATETEAAELSEGAAVYESPEADTAFEYTTLPTGLKEEIELEGPSSPSSFRYELTASPGLTPELAEDGSVVFKDEAGQAVASLPTPTVADANSPAPTSDHVGYQLAPRGEESWLLTVAVDPEWLEDPSRAWPAVVDPTMTAEKPHLDCVIGGKTGQEGWIDCASWGRQNLLAGYNAELNQAEDSWYHTLMYLSTAEIPAGADVTSANLMLHSPEAAQNTSGVQVREVTKPWTWQANWRNYDKGKAWTTEGGDSEFLGEETTHIRGSGAGWWTLPIAASKVQQRAEGKEDLSVLVKLTDDKIRQCGTSSCTHRLVKFDSSAATTVENRPYLRVVYDFAKAPAESKVSSPEQGRKSGHYFTLQSAWNNHSGTTGVTYQIKLPGWQEFRTIPAEYVLNGKGEQIEWPQPVEGNAGHSEPLFFDYRGAVFGANWAFYSEIKLRAVFAGGLAARGASEPVSVEYIGKNDGIGGTTDATISLGPANVDPLTGNFTLSRTDVSIPVPGSEANLEFTRTYESIRKWRIGQSQALGPNWEPSSPVEQEFEGEAWTSLVERHEGAIPATYDQECIAEGWPKEECMVEEEIPASDWIELRDNEGGEADFEIVGGGYVAPEYMKGWILTKEEGLFVLSGPEGVRIVFYSPGGNNEYQPKSTSWQATAKSVRMVYEHLEGTGVYQLIREIAPAPSGVTCGEASPTTTPGCRTLTFQYVGCGTSCSQMTSITYFGPSGSGHGEVVADYSYNESHQLVAEWDPRSAVSGGEPLKETYSYTKFSNLTSLTPPGQQPWQFAYYDSSIGWEMEGALKSVSRATLLESPATATSTIAYRVPVSGSGAPYDMSPATVATWGQSDYPVDAYAIFPPDQVPTEVHPTDFSHATVHYLDPEGYEVNTASPAPPGAEGPSIATAETDAHGNVVRELSPQNRLRALAAGSSSVARSHELDSHSTYSPDGTEMLESWGPLHQVRLENSETVEARAHQVVKYEDPAPPTGQPAYHLPTKETSGAAIAGRSEDADQRVSETHYNWTLRKPTETIVDPGTTPHLNIKSVVVYDEATGMPIETRQPSNSGGGGAGSTKTVYYSAGSNAEQPTCGSAPAYAGLPCKVMPGSQSSGTGRPELLVKTFPAYNGLDEPTEILEKAGEHSEGTRKTLFTYDAAGRQVTKKIEGGGVPIPKVETEYSKTLGTPVAERFKCETECGNPQFQTSIGYGSTGHSPLNRPTDVVVDAKGNVWVLDKNNNRVVEYNEAGEFLREAGGLGSGAGKLSSPSGIAIDSFGLIDVTDTANNRVVRFNESGQFYSAIGANVDKTKVEAGGTLAEKNHCTAASGDVCQAGSSGSGEGLMAEPIGITTSGGGNFFVVERANNRVEKFNLNGELLAKFGSTGSENGQLKEPTAIATAPNGSLWVADTGNNRIEQWNSSNVYSRKVEGSGESKLASPAALDVDSSGNVWVADKGNNRLEKFSETGTFLTKLGSAGSEEGQFAFSVPMGLDLDGAGNVFVADPGNNRVEKFSASGFDTQETKVTYDTLGRPTTYEDADGNKAETTYDLDGRPVKTSDNKGSQTLRYDATSGLPVELEDSAAGLFTATYNADGSMVKRTLPDGLTAQTTYDPAGEATHLSYTKASNCGANCLWLDFGLEMSINGQIVKEASSLGTDNYSYDKAGRLTSAQETPQGGSCTTRAYAYDVDSNRTSLTTRAPGVGGVCSNSGGTTQPYEYDAADRLMGSGITYDSFGRITSLPGTYAGGKTLTTTYFASDMVASQTQNGVTNTFQLDATLRQRLRLQGGGLEGAEVFHYDGPGDSPAWTERGSTWTRSIGGIGGELAAVQENGKEITLQLTNLHGDVSATAAVNPEVTSLKNTFGYDEFGNATSGSAGRFGWLGGRQRRSELSSGVVQMGARSYVPTIGRFISVDSIAGGSANSYDYANADPVNSFDLHGAAPDTPGAIECQDHLAVHHPHRSHHKRGRVNAVLTGQCYGTEVTHVKVFVTMTMFRNGRRIVTEPTRELIVTVTVGRSVSPTFKVPFHNAPYCKPGRYRAEASVTFEYPSEYVTANGTNTETTRISSLTKHISSCS